MGQFSQRILLNIWFQRLWSKHIRCENVFYWDAHVNEDAHKSSVCQCKILPKSDQIFVAMDNKIITQIHYFKIESSQDGQSSKTSKFGTKFPRTVSPSGNSLFFVVAFFVVAFSSYVCTKSVQKNFYMNMLQQVGCTFFEIVSETALEEIQNSISGTAFSCNFTVLLKIFLLSLLIRS